jgi:preprotein translocase subunit SecF
VGLGEKVEFFHNPKVNWLGYKWYFLAFSLIFSVAGVTKMIMNWHNTGYPVPLSIDFRGGTEVQVRFANRPDIDAIRSAIDAAGVKDARIQSYGEPSQNEALISLPEVANENSLDTDGGARKRGNSHRRFLYRYEEADIHRSAGFGGGATGYPA